MFKIQLRPNNNEEPLKHTGLRSKFGIGGARCFALNFIILLNANLSNNMVMMFNLFVSFQEERLA